MKHETLNIFRAIAYLLLGVSMVIYSYSLLRPPTFVVIEKEKKDESNPA